MYNKLVRDGIPDIIRKSGKKPNTRVLSKLQFREALEQKLEEEVEEHLIAKTEATRVEELADILEVVYALAELDGINEDQLESLRLKKRAKRGAFDQRIYLTNVE